MRNLIFFRVLTNLQICSKTFCKFKNLGTTPFQLQHHLLTEQLEFLEGLNFLQENAKEFFEEVLKDMVDGELFLTGNC